MKNRAADIFLGNGCVPRTCSSFSISVRNIKICHMAQQAITLRESGSPADDIIYILYSSWQIYYYISTVCKLYCIIRNNVCVCVC